MMWMMLICCALPLLFIVFLGAGGKALGAPTWIVLGVVAAMMVAHFFMMRAMHKGSDEEHETTDGEDTKKDVSAPSAEADKDDKKHSGRGCCH